MDFERAVHKLQSDPNAQAVTVTAPTRIEEQQPWFGRFVTALEQHRRIRLITFNYMYLTVSDDDAERLMGQILPMHPSLTDICFFDCHFLSQYIVLMTTAIARRQQQGPGIFLTIEHCNLDTDSVKALANMLRLNAPVRSLDLEDCEIELQPIFEGLEGNNQLHSLSVYGGSLSAINSTGWTAFNASRVEFLRIKTTFEVAMKADNLHSLVSGLKTNLVTTRLGFFFHVMPSFSFHELEDLLSTFNWTIRHVSFIYVFAALRERDSLQTRFNDLLRQNEAERTAHDQLQLGGYRLEDKTLWPHAMEVVRRKPTLMYRFLRQGNVDALADHLRDVLQPPSPASP